MEIRAIEDHELRLGNICLDADGNRHDIINGWQIDEGVELFGVPLTEKILLKCGLERAKEYGIHSFWVNKGWKIYYCAFNKGARFIERGWIADMQYLHQLQNLYFALTGTELEVNL
jgi:hypothetical protein